ncbi:TIM-barrel domain-containing protein [Hymenobacter gummosus]|nr:TIM-barrel domain-containing protein [Hymenobacter gummosus]
MLLSARRLPLLMLGLLALALPARAQREGGGPPTQDPFGRRETPAPVRAIGNYRSHQATLRELTVQSTDGSTLRVRRWAEGVVRVEYYPAGQPVRPDSSLSVVQTPHVPYPNTKLEAYHLNLQPDRSLVRNTPGALYWPLLNGGVITGHVVVQKRPLRVSYHRYGDTLVAEAGGVFRQLGAAGGTGVSFRLRPEEHLYGTGSRALPLDRRGRRVRLYNEAHYGYQNGEPTLNVSLPSVLSSRGYMLFFDHHTAATLDLGATDKNVLEYRGEGLRNLAYFIIAGDAYAEILDRYTALTGRQPLPPRWGLGLLQSRFGYRSETEMYQVARRMRQAGFPLDGLVLDLYWFGGTHRQGDFRWDAAHFPNPRRLTRRLDSLGVKTLLISEPYVMRSSLNDALVRSRGLVERDAQGQPYTVESFWAGPATLLDMYRPSTRQWLWQQYARLKQDGVAGWWTDLGEPENHPASMRSDGGPTRRGHNGYGQAWASILSEGYQQHYPQERLFNLARSGWAGMQRHAVFPWSGDVSRSWAGLQAQVPIMLSMGLGGVGYMHSDAGGFAQGTPDPELYARWLQLAALGPILRPHGGGEIAPEPYWWPPATQAAVRPYAQLRYRLLPYLYSLAWENSQTGTPLTRPMNYGATYLRPEESLLDEDTLLLDMADDWRQRGWSTGKFGWNVEYLYQWRDPATGNDAAALSNVNDQFLLGPNLLVAPVLQPGQRRRNVVLPPGNWIDFDSHQTLPGGRTVGRVAPLQRLPLLVRGGAFLPLTRYRPSTAQYRPDTLQVQYYADPSAGLTTFAVYEDDGRSARTAAATYHFQALTLHGLSTAAETRVTMTLSGQPYPGRPPRRVVELLIPRVPAPPTAVLLGAAPLPPAAWQHEAATRTLRLRVILDTTAAGHHLALRLLNLPLDTAAAPYLDPELLTLEAPAARAFRGGTELRYTLHQPTAPGPLRIVGSRGELVRRLPVATTAGPHRLTWDGRDEQGRPLPGGVYWAELAGQRQRLVLLP